MKKYSWLSPVLILIFVLGTLIFLSPLFVPDSVTNWPIKKKLNLGLDLRGGIQIVLGLDTKGLSPAEIPDAVDSNIEIIRNRIDQFGVAEPSIQKIGEDRIVVQLPGAKDRTGAEDLVKRTAMLNFKLVATADEAQSVVTQIDDIIKTNPSMFPELVELERKENAELKKRGIEADSLASQNGMFKRLLVSQTTPFPSAKTMCPSCRNFLPIHSSRHWFPRVTNLPLAAPEGMSRKRWITASFMCSNPRFRFPGRIWKKPK